MEPFVTSLFLREIITQCEYAEYAISELRRELSDRNPRRVFFYAQAFLIAAGNVSKLLWPPGSQGKERGEILRTIVGVSDNNAVNPRTFRNHFEHFDERIEVWAQQSKYKMFVDQNIMDSPGTVSGIDPAEFFRNLAPSTLTLTFRGDAYELAAVENALSEIQLTTSKKEKEFWSNQ